ncbi:MAG: hypothetical protein IPP72_07200 [Chitinophagaceae bacterium]|nr:hypothetical protein [Chitinophagaceae bacterium]
MRKVFLLLIICFIAGNLQAQWTPLALNYKYVRHKEFFIPVAMHFSDSSNGFILNNDHLLQYKDQLWQPVKKNETDEFTYTNVFTLNTTNTFLCSYDGKIAKYNGDSLAVLFAIPQTETSIPTLNTIFMIDSSKGWTAGDGGTLIKIDGDSIEQDSISNLINFRDIYFNGPDHGWMIGLLQTDIGNFGVVCEYADSHWSINSYLDEMLYDIEFSSPDSGFITGQQGIYRYNKDFNEWQPENIPNYYRQYHLSMLNDGYGISVSDSSRNLIYENGTWTEGPAAVASDLISVKTIEPGKAWAISQIGENKPEDFNEGKMQLMQNYSWAAYPIRYLDSTSILPVDYVINNVTGVGKKDIWLNGQHLTIPPDRDWYDTIPTLASDSFYTVSRMLSNDLGFATNGNLMEWDGQYWINKNIESSSPDTSFINLQMHVFDDTTAFICRQFLVWGSGEFKSTIALYDHNSNSLLSTATLDSRSTFGVHFSDKRNGWCVGDSGLMVQHLDTSWQILPAITDNRLNSVFTIDSAAAWAVGNLGTLLKYNGAEWVKDSLPTVQNLYSIYFTDSTHGWIAGDSGLIFSYNGSGWLKDTTVNTTGALYSIYMVDSTYGFVSGDNGTLLQYIKKDTITPSPPVKQICESGNTYFSYDPVGTGYMYQWQIDTGNGFENLIADDTLYAGVFSDTLRITLLSSYLYGYKYRCIASYEGVDSISNVEELIFKNRWTGNVDSTWENPANWSCGMLPGTGTDVIISEGNVVINSSVAIRSLTVLTGVNITIAESGGLEILK